MAEYTIAKVPPRVVSLMKRWVKIDKILAPDGSPVVNIAGVPNAVNSLTISNAVAGAPVVLSAPDGFSGVMAAADVHATTAKTVPVDADEFVILDSAASYAAKRMLVSAWRTVAKTFTNTKIQKRAVTVTPSASMTIDTDITDVAVINPLATAAAITTTGTPTNGDELYIRITDDGTARALTWNSGKFKAGSNLASTTRAGVTMHQKCIWDNTQARWIGQDFDHRIADITHAATSKATPVDADEIPLVDSAAANVLKKLTVANLKALIFDYIVGAAPGTLDTLDELAAALGDDANFAASMTAALALKAPLASPTFTGTVAGLSVLDTQLTVKDNGDPTKAFAFQASGITAGQTRNITIPDYDFTIKPLVKRGRGATSGGTVQYGVPGVEFFTVSTQSQTANNTYYYPFRVESPVTLTDWIAEATTGPASGANLHIGVFVGDGDLQPSGNALYESGAISVATSFTGTKSGSSVGLSLPIGKYLLAFNVDVTCTWRAFGAPTPVVATGLGATPLIGRFAVADAIGAGSFPTPGAKWGAQSSSNTGLLFPALFKWTEA